MEGYIGEIRLFAGNFAPKNWAYCSGQIINIASNTALFSILGTTYGGNGQTTFALPDFRGRVAISQGQGPGLPNYALGQASGETNHTLIITEMPSHNHVATAMASTDGPTTNNPANNYLATGSRTVAMDNIYAATNPNARLGASAVQVALTGGSQPHNNMQPYLAVNYIICMYGIYPSRN